MIDALYALSLWTVACCTAFYFNNPLWFLPFFAVPLFGYLWRKRSAT